MSASHMTGRRFEEGRRLFGLVSSSTQPTAESALGSSHDAVLATGWPCSVEP